MDVAWGRHLFLTKGRGDDASFMIGLGPESMQPGDEVWMLKGGKVLYILRQHTPAKLSTAGVIDVCGGLHYIRTFARGEIVYQVIGEAFMMGLMDGKILGMMGEAPKRQRPPPLADMDREFRTIYLK
jgi:hypothetical protein